MRKSVILLMLLVCTCPVLAGEPKTSVTGVLDRLSVSSYRSYMSMLSEGFTTRYSCSEEILDARDAIVDTFEGFGYNVQTPGFDSQCEGDCYNQDGFNVVAIKTGAVRPQEYYLIGAHYDSVNENNYCGPAPGAGDNASGAAGVLELARVFADVETEASLIFVTFGGEEIDLLGSRQLAKTYAQNGMLDRIKGFVILDLISYWNQRYAVIVEGSDYLNVQYQAVQQIADLVVTYTDLNVSTSYYYSDSDHVPFLNRNVPGALLICKDWDVYPYIHSGNDVMAHQDVAFGLEIVKVAGATLAAWSMTDETPSDDDDNDNDNDDNNDNIEADDDDDDGGCGC